MRTITTLATAVLVCCAGAAMATDLTLTLNVTSGPTVAPGGTVDFEIVGLLSSDVDNEGLALFGVDLSASGPATINLSTDATVSAPVEMANFVSPDGLNNPTACGGCFGFGGTASSNDLIQIGGGMNTIGNDIGNAPYPIGSVTTNVAFSTNGISVLATGSLTAPATLGTYTLTLSNGFANVISLGETGPTVYATEAVGVVTHVGDTFDVVDAGCAALDARSLVDHGTGDLPLTVGVTGGIEPRFGGVRKLEIDLDSASGFSGGVTVNCSPTAYGGSAVHAGTVGDTVTITFTPGLPDETNCTIDLDCGASVCVRNLEGDSNLDGATNPVDNNQRLLRFGQTAAAAGVQWDVNTDGSVNPVDDNQTLLRFGNSAPACP